MEERRMRRVTVLAAVLTLAACLAAGEDEDDPMSVVRALKERFDGLHEQTSFYNLINGLNLDAKQMRELLEINRRFERELEGRLEKMKEDWGRALETIERWRDAVREQRLPEDRIAEVRKAVDTVLEYGRRSGEILRGYSKELRAVFTDAQREIISNFEPCVIPPDDLRDPVRAGQARSSDELVKAMRRIRGVPKWGRARAIELATEKFVEWETRLARLTEKEQAEERGRIAALLRRACGMKDVDFELNKEKLSAEFLEGSAYEKVQALAKKMEQLAERFSEAMAERGAWAFDRYLRYFLNPALVVPALSERLEKVQKGEEKREEKERDGAAGGAKDVRP